MKNIFYFLLFSLLLLSCKDDVISEENVNTPEISSDGAGIYVDLSTRSDGWKIEDEYAQFIDNVGENEEKPYIITEFKDGDILFISQRGTTESPELYNMQTNEKADGAYTKNTVKKNLYVYQYKKPDNDADWTEGSNFIPYINNKNDSTPMDWNVIKNLGSVGNAFSFYALFQGNNKTPNCRTVQWMNYSGDFSEYDPHSAKELGERYGLFGAYHATSSLYTRMRFRLYPLFNLLHVTLLIPVQEANEDDAGYTGFGPNVFKNNWAAGNSSNQILPGLWFGVPVWAVNSGSATTQAGIATAFTINWNANRSSDNDPPLIDPVTSGNVNTCFYLLRYDEDDPDAEHPEFKIDNVRDFYPQSDRESDMVRRYEFICYYVPQDFYKRTNFNALLSMRLLTPGSSGNLYYITSNYTEPMSVEGTYVPYFFYGNSKGQSQYAGGDYGDLGFDQQGMYQHLTLYIPRKGNQTVLVSARVKPWKETYTDMTIVERENY